MQVEQYYKSVFPFDLVKEFFDRNSSRDFSQREFSLVWGDATQRFNSYSSAERTAADFAKRKPEGVSVGAVYSTNPALRYVISLDQLVVAERELVFDIDLTDYDDVRTCDCKHKKKGLRCCRSCWTLAIAGLFTLRYLLRHKFGLYQFLFVFSGSKGVHCWVLDEQAKSYMGSTRKGIADYFWPFSGRPGTDSACASLVGASCPVLEACYRQVMLPFFESHILGRVLDFSKPAHQRAADECARLAGYNGALFSSLPAAHSREMWRGVRSKLGDTDLFRRVERAVVFRYCFPRIDMAVTSTSEHTLRCPLSLNPKTGCVVMPFELEKGLSFNLLETPSLANFAEGARAGQTILRNAMEPPWDRLWLCRECTDKRVPISETSTVYTYEQALLEHCSEQHHPHPDTNQSTLASYAKSASEIRAFYLEYLRLI